MVSFFKENSPLISQSEVTLASFRPFLESKWSGTKCDGKTWDGGVEWNFLAGGNFSSSASSKTAYASASFTSRDICSQHCSYNKFAFPKKKQKTYDHV